MPNTTVIDLETILERLSGDRAMLAVLANYFLVDAPQYLQQIHDGLRTNSLSHVHESAHCLRSVTSTFEPTPVADLLVEIEIRGRNGDATQLPELMAQLDAEFAKLTDALAALATPIGDDVTCNM